ncbi:hypothetical protein CHUAL_012839 [Chamberlinius hualienensis]
MRPWRRRWLWSRSILLYLVILSCQGVSGRRDTVNIDLNTGVVTGYSRHVTFLVPPAQSGLRGHCVRQAVIKLSLHGNPFNKATIHLEFEKPRLWTLHLTKSLFKNSSSSKTTTVFKQPESELHVFNRQLSIHDDIQSSSIDVNGPSTRLFDEVLNKGRSKLLVTIADGQLQWTPSKGKVEKIEWPIDKLTNEGIYVGLNRLVGGDWTGSGLCHARIQLRREEG